MVDRMMKLFGRRARRPARPCLKALDVLHAASLDEARADARRVLARAQQCACCKNLLSHVYDRVGSTLFIDDDPRCLAEAFEPVERDGFAQRVLAALIVLKGRERIAVPS